MGKKYWFVIQQMDLPQYARHSSVARPGLAINREDSYSVFDKMVDEIRLEMETLTGSKPELINFTSAPKFGPEVAELKWCVFDEQAAIALAMLVGGKVVEYDWDVIKKEMSEEERLVNYFEEIVTKSWDNG